MAYVAIANGETGLSSRNKINGIGTGLDTHTGLSGSSVHSLGTVALQSASALSLTGILNVSGSITASGSILSNGYIIGKKVGIFAYLSGSATTTVVTSGSYYPINGSFANNPAEGFSFVASPAVRYDGDLTQYFKIDWHAVLSSDHSSCTTTLGIRKNNILLSESLMSNFMKLAGEPSALGGVLVVELKKNDEIQLVLTSDGDGDTIKLVNYTTTMNQFFR